MKAMTLSQYGDDAQFQVAELPTPTPKTGQVLVKVAASSINVVDTMIRQMGSELPFAPAFPAVLGMDFAGTVEAVGEGVLDYAPGDEVYGCAGGLADLQGSLADLMVADTRLIAPKPKNLSMRQAAALPLVSITAYEGLQRAGAKAGQKVLVQGGAGGVGHVAVQLAKHLGAEVYATGTNENQMRLIEGFGATAINAKNEKTAEYVERYTQGAGFDVIFDSVGGANMANSFEAAALNGQVASTVAMVDLDLTTAHFKGLSLHVVFMLIPMLHDHKREEHAAILRKLAEIAEAGGLTPLIDETRFSLEDAGKAYAHMIEGKAVGKVVIEA